MTRLLLAAAAALALAVPAAPASAYQCQGSAAEVCDTATDLVCDLACDPCGACYKPPCQIVDCTPPYVGCIPTPDFVACL